MTRDSNSDAARVRPLICAPGAGPTLDVLGVPHVYKAMASDTGGQFSIWESVVPPGGGTPLHTHTREDEAFYVMSGEVGFDVQRESEGAIEPLRLGTGGFLFAPRNLRHGYRNTGPPRSASACVREPRRGSRPHVRGLRRRGQRQRGQSFSRHPCRHCHPTWRDDPSAGGVMGARIAVQ